MEQEYTIRDPFAGTDTVHGETLDKAIAEAYRDIPESERPAYVWHKGEQVHVPGGTCRPTS